MERCRFCAGAEVGQVRVPGSLRAVSFCAVHHAEAVAEADRIHAIVTRPCSKCGAPAPYYHHRPDCPRIARRG